MNCLCIFVSLLGLGLVTALDEGSPVLLWSPERSMVDLPDVGSVDSFGASDFYDQYLSPLVHGGQENAVIFLQDKLSVDDFTKYADVFSSESHGGAFKNVKRLMDDHFSLELPSVDTPHVALDKVVNNFEGHVHTVDGLSQLETLQLGREGEKFLLIVNLQPILGARDEEEVISNNDAIVGNIAKHLKSKGIKYCAVFTGKSAQPNHINAEEAEGNDSGSQRHLMAAETVDSGSNNNCSFMNVSKHGIYVFLCSVDICVKEKSDPKVCAIKLSVDATVDDAMFSTKKDNNTAELILTYKGVKDSDTKKGAEYDVKITMNVVLKRDRWEIKRNTLDLNETSGSAGVNKTLITNATVFNRDVDTVIPRLFSFHCSKLRLQLETVRDTTYKDYAGTSVSLKGFQFQVFDFKGNFLNAQDCVGFFTAGIWMGIVPGLLLVAIMVYGTLMVLSLSVMDKFDDPKGKTITVNVGES